MNNRIVIAIDGPSGAGKSTVAKALATELGLKYLDTGAMYRALGRKAAEAGLGDHEGELIATLMESTTIDFGPGDPQAVLLDGVDVTLTIRTSDAGTMASKISSHTPVRRALVACQKKIVAEGGYVLDGRDTTTVVAPNADVKVYLTASLEERARRRLQDLLNAGESADFDSVRLALEERDHRDINRGDSPLMVAEGAIVIESGSMDADEVVAVIKALIPSA